MRLIHIKDVEEGTLLAKAVHDSKLAMLVPAGAKCTQSILNKLAQLDIRHLYIEDEISEGIVLEPMISDEIKLHAVSLMKRIYEAQSKEGDSKEEAMRESMISELKNLVDDVISEIYNKSNQRYYSTELLGAEIYHYDHAVEVMILSLLIGKKIGLDRERLLKLGMGAILADIGKSKVPAEILNKKGKLTEDEFEEVKRHVTYSYNILKNLVGLSSLSRQIVLLHHEKLDGSGYPNGLKGDDIPLLVRIATVCDIFSAIVADRTYNQRISVDTALEILRSASPVKLDVDVVQALFQVVDIYPPGTIVALSDERHGIVLENNPSSPTRPKLRIIEKVNQETVYKEVDMMSDLTLFIKKVLPKLPDTL